MKELKKLSKFLIKNNYLMNFIDDDSNIKETQEFLKTIQFNEKSTDYIQALSPYFKKFDDLTNYLVKNQIVKLGWSTSKEKAKEEAFSLLVKLEIDISFKNLTTNSLEKITESFPLFVKELSKVDEILRAERLIGSQCSGSGWTLQVLNDLDLISNLQNKRSLVEIEKEIKTQGNIIKLSGKTKIKTWNSELDEVCCWVSNKVLTGIINKSKVSSEKIDSHELLNLTSTKLLLRIDSNALVIDPASPKELNDYYFNASQKRWDY